MNGDKELDILERIQKSTGPVRQRSLASAIGLSLGMTNAIMKRLAKKGWITVRKTNSRNIHYAVSAKGLEEIARRSYKYLRRTIGHVVRYKEAIENLVRAAKSRGCLEVVLVGKSDLEFLLEYACSRNGLVFRVISRRGAGEHGVASSRLLLVESRDRWENEPRPEGCVFLYDLLIGGSTGESRPSADTQEEARRPPASPIWL